MYDIERVAERGFNFNLYLFPSVTVECVCIFNHLCIAKTE